MARGFAKVLYNSVSKRTNPINLLSQIDRIEFYNTKQTRESLLIGRKVGFYL
ncbi:hypothetical protein [Spirosoma endbachense]|uniref:Uncharacterized protein n=1 Tax=Spirosoma endbachense TaxID=2666025 RepID=A0A6P1VS85_9BACT|nr:hypothetical protein [Spirosoma endbachense]QHV95555.1 hypothetical protein GJR95_11320 [Spirosoma endbachense]